MKAISLTDCYQCAKRELALRRRLYPRFVASGKLTQDEADRELLVMEKIMKDYQKQVNDTNEGAPLFA